MAKVKVSFDEKNFARTVTKVFDKVRANKQLRREVGEFVSKRLASEGRRGKPLNKEGKFPALEPSTVKNRAARAKTNQTGRPFSPNKSNLTLTQQLWNGLGFFLKDRTVVEIKFAGKRKPTKTSSGKFEKMTSFNRTNADLAKNLAEGIQSKRGLKKYIAFDGEIVADNDKINLRIKNITLRFLRRALKAARFRA